jgi:excisionase family DNA binding protein
MTPAEKRAIDGGATLLTTDQVAEILGMQRQTIYTWARNGKLDAIKLPGGKQGKLRFRRDYIEAIIGGAL